MMKSRGIRSLVACVLVAGVFVSGCDRESERPATVVDGQRRPIKVGSKIDTEGELLSSMIQLRLEGAGLKVEDRSQTGPTEVVRQALLSGDIDIYPEYTGSGLLFFEGDPQATMANFKDAEKGYAVSKKLDAANGIVWLTPAKANNTWAICAKKDFAEKNGLRTVSDLAAWARSGKPVRLAASDEFFNNIDAWPSFAKAYGFDLSAKQRVIFSGGNTAQTEKAVARGTDGVNFGMAYGTDGSLSDLGLVILQDDKKAQPVYWPVPIARKAILDEYPEIADLLEPVFESLTLERLQQLNARIQVDGERAQVVADDYLRSRGLLEDAPR